MINCNKLVILNSEQMKQHIFFDAEGTLYVTNEGKDYNDFWNGEHTLERALEFFHLDEGMIEFLTYLKRSGYVLYVVSKHIDELLLGLLEYFGITDFFNEIMINGDKGQRINDYISRRNISPEECVMFGDHFDLDIDPVIRVGVDAILVSREYNRNVDAFRVDRIHDYFIRNVINN